jgi:capsular exopolysaccharide synthesis family protein
LDDQSQTPLTSAALLRVLRRRIRILVLSVLVVIAAAVVFSLVRETQYSATTTLLFRDPQLDQKLFGSGTPRDEDPFRTAATNLQLASLEIVADRTAADVGGLSGDDVDSKVDTSERGQSDLVSITATDADPERAALIANTFATNFIDLRRRANRKNILEAEATVRRRIQGLEATPAAEPEEKTLRSRLEELSVLASVQTGNAEIAERAQVPENPSTPGVVWSGVLGLLFGLVLGVGLAFLFDRIDRRLRDPREVEEAFRRPMLGFIPRGGRRKRGGEDGELAPGAARAFRSMGANLRYFAVGGEMKTIVVTSAMRGDGKTTIAWNLAAATAIAGRRALLVEADLWHPSLAIRFGLERTAGLSDVLAGQADWERAILRIPIEQPPSDEPSQKNFDLLPAGPVPPNPADLLGAESMTELIRRAEERYDAVFIDTPATTITTEAVPLLGHVDGTIVVVRLGNTTRDELERLRGRLAALNARILGLVINSAAPRGESDDADGDEAGERLQETALTG